MNTAAAGGPVPQPVPLDSSPPPPAPEPRPPAVLRVCQVQDAGQWQVALIYKRSYRFDPVRGCTPAEEQTPLDEDGAAYDPLPPNEEASIRSLPEVIGFRLGTDLIVQGHARSAQPVSRMYAGVQVGPWRHVAEVVGRRVSTMSRGRIAFTEPEPFTEMALRYENAYGGRDPHAEEALLAETARSVTPEQLRRVRPLAVAMLANNHVLMYPRNRFGKGYVLSGDTASIEGRELPNLERPDDRLTPDRLVVPHALHWSGQPLPAGFDFLDPRAFPRCAMLGMPPASLLPLEAVAEVTLGLVPPDYARGNIFTTTPERMSELIHPWASRCASPGLTLPFLRGDEDVLLAGMDTDWSPLRVRLPAEVPLLGLAAPPLNNQQVPGQLQQVKVEVDARIVEMIWVARFAAPGPFTSDQLLDLEQHARLEMRSLR